MSRVPNDYHLHTAFSCDSQATMAAQCEAAIALGLREICVTDHSDWEPLDSCSGFYRPDAYFAELAANRERYGDRLTIRAGVEIGEIHRVCVEAARPVSYKHLTLPPSGPGEDSGVRRPLKKKTNPQVTTECVVRRRPSTR